MEKEQLYQSGQTTLQDSCNSKTVLTSPIPCKVVSTLAGSVGGYQEGKGIISKFNYPRDLILSPIDQCLYLCDHGNNMIRKITKSGEVSKWVTCLQPISIKFYEKAKCYFVSEWETHSIKRISITGETSTLAGGTEGYRDGERDKAKFKYPCGIAVNQDTGDIYVADSFNHIIRKITQEGIVTTLAPKKHRIHSVIKSHLFKYPYGICFHPQQQAIIVCDFGNNILRKVFLNGKVSSVCKIPSPVNAITCYDGSILVSSDTQHVFRVYLQENSTPEIFAGSGRKGNNDGLSHESEFDCPYGIVYDNETNTCFITDARNHRIRAIHF